MEISEEQMSIVNSDDTIVFIQACAGAGKTYTLQLFAEKNMNKKILYVAFNRHAKEYAQMKFKENVTCKTLDSICFDICLSHSKELINVSPKFLIEHFKIPFDRASKCIDLLSKFCSQVKFDLIEHFWKENQRKYNTFDFMNAKNVWYHLCNEFSPWYVYDINRKRCQIQLKKTFLYLDQFEVILIDECQDLNEIFTYILLSWKGKKIFVGDDNQSIYSFMGNVNLFSSTHPSLIGSKRFKLSKSYRYGKDIAQHASNIILIKKNIQKTKRTIDFFTKKEAIKKTTPSKHVQFYRADVLPITILARYNKTLFTEAYDLCTLGFDYSWSGQDEILDKMKQLSESFGLSKKWNSQRKMAELEHNTDLLALMDLMSKFEPGDFKNMLDVMKSRNKATADIILSSVHKSKGSEWNSVMIMPDIADSILKVRNDKVKYEEECNIYYVAVTRAKELVIDLTYLILTDELNL